MITQLWSLLGSSKLSRKLQAWLSVSELSPWIRIVQNLPFITDCVTNSVAEPPRFSCDSDSGLNTFLLLLLGHFFWKLNFSERLSWGSFYKFWHLTSVGAGAMMELHGGYGSAVLIPKTDFCCQNADFCHYVSHETYLYPVVGRGNALIIIFFCLVGG